MLRKATNGQAIGERVVRVVRVVRVARGKCIQQIRACLVHGWRRVILDVEMHDLARDEASGGVRVLGAAIEDRVAVGGVPSLEEAHHLMVSRGQCDREY